MRINSSGVTTILSAAFVISLGFGYSVASVINYIVNGNQHAHMEFVGLEYKDNQIGQRFNIESDAPVPANWIAQITRGNHVLCSGFGKANYAPRKATDIKWFSINDWVGDECPPLKDGDKAVASWQYTNRYGFPVTIIGSVEIKQPEG